MKVLTRTLSRDLESIVIHPLADLHVGDPLCDIAAIKSKIQEILETNNEYVILNGDLLNNAITTSVSDVYGEKHSPKEAKRLLTKLFKPLAKQNKILMITPGNHENRTYKQVGVDLTEAFAEDLGLGSIYCNPSGLLFLRFGIDKKHDRPLCYSIYAQHNTGAGGRKEGAKVNKLIELSNIVDADIYIGSHTHLPFATKVPYHRTSQQNNSVKQIDRLFINTAASLKYGGYGELAGFKPASTCNPRIELSGVSKYATGIL